MTETLFGQQKSVVITRVHVNRGVVRPGSFVLSEKMLDYIDLNPLKPVQGVTLLILGTLQMYFSNENGLFVTANKSR